MIPTDWATLDSSNVSAIKYDADNSVLHVRFKNGNSYAYDNVPPETVEGFYHASSPGSYLRENIIGTHAHRRT